MKLMMAHTFTRKELYDLVWSEPMHTLAGKYAISDRGLAKACEKAGIPVPERGYWNKLKAGKPVSRVVLPPRGIGVDDDVEIGGSYWGSRYLTPEQALVCIIPPEPVFDVDMEFIRTQATARANKAPLPKTIDKLHRALAKILADEEKRQEKRRASGFSYSWDEPIFNTPFEKRRLKILNGIFTCLECCGMRPAVHGKTARDLSVMVGDTNIHFTLDSVNASRQIERERSGHSFEQRGAQDDMELFLTKWYHPDKQCQSWRDKEGDRLENHLREIVIDIMVAGEEA